MHFKLQLAVNAGRIYRYVKAPYLNQFRSRHFLQLANHRATQVEMGTKSEQGFQSAQAESSEAE